MLELDTEIISQVAAGVRNGEWPVRCLVRLGVPQKTAAEWMRLGEDGANEDISPDSDVHVALFRAVDVAESDCEKAWLDECRRAAKEGKRTAEFTGSMTLLERRFPERYCVRGVQNRRKGGKEAESLEEILKRLQDGD